jgi:SP family general alpha glucoside:H+ symporter-like MFS transporter
VFPAITVAGLLFVPTSPVFLVKRGLPSEAATAIARLHGLKDEQTIRARLAVIQHTVAMEQQAKAALGAVTTMDLFRDKIDRKRTLLTLGVWVCFNLAGSAFLGSGLYFLQQQVSCSTQDDLATNFSSIHTR